MRSSSDSKKANEEKLQQVLLWCWFCTGLASKSTSALSEKVAFSEGLTA
jgi:hypothetical protein